jgi:hypothetical protein
MVAGDISVVFAECSCWAGIWAKLGNTNPTAITRATRIVIISRGQDLFAKQCSKPGNGHSASAEMDRAQAIASVVSRMTMRNIRQNLVFAFAYNVIGIPVAAGVLYPTFGILLSPVVAAFAMSLSSVSVIANALRLRAAKL